MIDYPYHCEHSRTEIRERTHQNGMMHFVGQCLRCGRQVRAYRKDSPEVRTMLENGGVQRFDELLRGVFEQNARADYEVRRLDTAAEFWSEYTEYLKSKEWQARREKVLRRDSYICQACLERRATQVHHLSYKHRGREPLFDLVAVCDECHEAITETERESRRG